MRILSKSITPQEPMYYYIGRISFTNSSFPNGQKEISISSATIKDAETQLLDYAEKHCLTGELSVHNIRFDELVRAVQFDFSNF